MRISASIVLALLIAAVAQAASIEGQGEPDFGIYEVRIDGTGRQALLRNPEVRNVADISPDRTRILFLKTTPDRREQLYSAALDGSDARPIFMLEGTSVQQAAWSSSGRRIAIEVTDYSGCQPGSRLCAVGEIWLANFDGSGLRALLSEAIAPSWSPNSRRIAYMQFRPYERTGKASVANTNGELRQRDLGRAEPGAWGSWRLFWSPRGDRFGYTTQRSGRPRVALVRASGFFRDSVRTARAGSFAAWSPDGRRFVYRVGPRARLFVARADGRHRRLLTTGWGPVRWSPDGRWIAFAQGPVCPQIFLIRPNGRDRHRVTNEPCPTYLDIYWTPDSRRIIYPVRY